MDAPFMTFSSPFKLVISTVGKDRPGLVARMCEAISNAQGNIDDSTMTRLGGQFSMIYIVHFTRAEDLERFKDAIVEIKKEGLFHVDLCLLSAEDEPMLPETQIAPKARKYLLSVGGYDRTGITYAFSKALAGFGINITDLHAHRINGENGIVYMLAIEMDVPLTVNDNEMKTTLENLGQKLNLDVRLRSMDAIIL
jgi:glycine cleavage system transcriptional repressor